MSSDIISNSCYTICSIRVSAFAILLTLFTILRKDMLQYVAVACVNWIMGLFNCFDNFFEK